MEYKGVVITGTSGSGKSTIARKLGNIDLFEIARAVTTRKQRKDDLPGEYDYITAKQFMEMEAQGKLLVRSVYRGDSYGIAHDSVESVKNKGKTPILVVTPESAGTITGFFSVFIDVNDNLLNERLRRRGDDVDELLEQQRKKDREHLESFTYIVQNFDLKKSLELIYALWDYRNVGGFLPFRIIQLMIECGMLLSGADVKNVQGASYDLSLGDEYYYAGKIRTLKDTDPFVCIEPYDYAIVTSRENANMPRDVAGKFDLSISLFCQGVILSNGPQVDPGFKGKLFCLLFNTSNSTVFLKRGQHYATMEFNKLIEPTKPYDGKYQNKLHIVDYLPSNTLQGAVNELKKELERVKSETRGLQTTILGTISLLLGIIALLLSLRG